MIGTLLSINGIYTSTSTADNFIALCATQSNVRLLFHRKQNPFNVRKATTTTTK